MHIHTKQSLKEQERKRQYFEKEEITKDFKLTYLEINQNLNTVRGEDNHRKAPDYTFRYGATMEELDNYN